MLPIPPEAALGPGRGDPAALLCIWYARKASYGIIALGLLVGIVIGSADEVTIGADTPDQFWDQLRSPLAGVVTGFAIRVLASFVALALAFPLARARETHLPPRAYLGSSLTGILDRLHAARAYRSLRWTHHVRQIALGRLGETGRRLAYLDPIMDAVNVTLFVIAMTALALSGTG
jgi:hypothetical protein